MKTNWARASGSVNQTTQESEEPLAGRHPVLIADGAGYIGNGALWVGLCYKGVNKYLNILAIGESLRVKIRNEAIFN